MRKEKAYEKYAWVLVVLGGVIWLVFGSLLVLYGLLSAGSVFIGPFILAGAVFQISLGMKAFRRGEKWAWFALLSISLVAFLDAYLDTLQGQSAAAAVGSFFTFDGLTLIGLLLSIRKFFPKKQPVSP